MPDWVSPQFKIHDYIDEFMRSEHQTLEIACSLIVEEGWSVRDFMRYTQSKYAVIMEYYAVEYRVKLTKLGRAGTEGFPSPLAS